MQTTNTETQTTKKERAAYYVYFFGQNMFYMIIASYITLFLLNQGFNEALAAIVVALFIPSLCRKIDKFWLYIGSLILFIAASVIQFFTGYGNDISLDITMALRGIGLVGYNVLVYMFTPDCIEYGQYRTFACNHYSHFWL